MEREGVTSCGDSPHGMSLPGKVRAGEEIPNMPGFPIRGRASLMISWSIP